MSESKTVFLMPGDIYFSNGDEQVMTVLGYCVSIIFYDREQKIAGVSHCLLPSNTKILNGEIENKFKYVDETIDFMINQFKDVGSKKKDIVVKLFGGASISNAMENSALDVGNRNVHMAKKILKEKGFIIKKHDTGGTISRKIIVSVSNGDVFLKRLI